MKKTGFVTSFFTGKPRGRGPVVHLSRVRKARMIEAILADHLGGPITGLRVLDIGAGNGQIGEYFAAANRVDSVDIADQRDAEGKAVFTLVDSERLPFADNTFDVVVSHHVIEHVEDQSLHLREIRRVLNESSGVVYLATPNRSSPIMEGHVGNELVLRWEEMVPRLRSAGFAVIPYGWKVLKHPDRFLCEVSLGRFVPASALRRLQRFYPSHTFILEPVASV